MKTVLSIGAHPDDIEIGCGGTEIILKSQGLSIIHVIVTNGEEGSLNQIAPDFARLRKQEAQASAQVIGADEVIFLEQPDGLTNYSKEVKIELIKLIRHYRPHLVFTHSSSDHFPDHSIVHALTIAAIEVAKGPWYPLAGGNPHQVDTILGYEVWHPINKHQLIMDISAVMEKKIFALNKHQTQVEVIDYREAVKALGRYRGIMGGLGCVYAEVYEVIQEKLVF